MMYTVQQPGGHRPTLHKQCLNFLKVILKEKMAGKNYIKFIEKKRVFKTSDFILFLVVSTM